MQQPEHLPGEGDRRAAGPARASRHARQAGLRRRGDGDAEPRIDWLARSTFDLFGIVKRIVDAKAQFRSLAEPWADTGTSTGRLMLAVLGGLAEYAEPAVMRSDAIEVELWPALSPFGAPHNIRVTDANV
jgi:hypothetical protein